MIAYTTFMFDAVFALIATAMVLILTVCVGSILYALYKGATDETWR